MTGRGTPARSRRLVGRLLATLAFTLAVLVVPTGTASAAPPSEPRSLTATAGDRSATLRWTAPASTGGPAILDYRVERSLDGTAWTLVNSRVSRTATSFTVSGLVNGTRYHFRIAARNSDGLGTWSATAVVTLPTARAVVAGRNHTCAIRIDRRVVCWGSNLGGQLGDGTTTPRPSPVLVSTLTNASALALGERHTCALRTDRTVWCWGTNRNGQLGDGTTTDRLTPVQVPGITTGSTIAAGARHTCVTTTAGTASCWGFNTAGQLGNGTTRSTPTPTAIALTGVSVVTAGQRHTCVRLSGRSMRCFGANGRGQLGNGGNTPSSTPVTVAGLTNGDVISSGRSHMCTRRTDSRCGAGATTRAANSATAPPPTHARSRP